WYKWMELRSHNEVTAIKTPTGLVPKYEDLKRLFKEVLKKDYSKEAYDKQFALRIPENLAKIERIKKIYENKAQIPDAPEIVFRALEEQKVRLMQAKEKFGDYITPDKFLS
ncbi:MAG TPA: phosphoenolpyruvate carboxykinase domain-containing protein, partial [Terriglobales bacterium]|nr:phosphoenolpyruvate carboxykinase domain-containing protein [Terriglobales bacterium]